MVYTVKQLSKLAGVTVRALHFYEEKNLLHPAFYGENGYRYYEEKELLRLQQILFFKELKFSIQQIQKVMDRDDFDVLAALHSHRQAMGQEFAKIAELLKTIDKTIDHIKGAKKMQENEFFSGFSLVKKGLGLEPYFAAEEIVLKSVKKQVKKEDRESLNKATREIYAKISQAADKGLEPSSSVVQGLGKRHYALIEEMHHATKEVYQAYAKLYVMHPEFRLQLESIHSGFADYMAKAMNFFAEKKL